MNRTRVLVIAAACLIAAAAGWFGGSARAGTNDACAAGRHLYCAQNVPNDSQPFELFDKYGAPLLWVNKAGGTWAGNDKLGLTGPSVFGNIAYLSPVQNGEQGPCVTVAGCHGVLVLDGRVLDGADIRMVRLMVRAHVTLKDLQWLARHG